MGMLLVSGEVGEIMGRFEMVRGEEFGGLLRV